MSIFAFTKILLEQRYLEMIAHIELLEIIASSNFFFLPILYSDQKSKCRPSVGHTK